MLDVASFDRGRVSRKRGLCDSYRYVYFPYSPLTSEPDWACDAPLQPPRAPTPPPQDTPVVEDRPVSSSRGPLFRDTLAEESDSGSDSDDEPDMDKANQSWAKLMLQLDTLRSGSETKKGGKKKGNNVVLETPEMRSIKTAMAKVEKEYMFSRKEAGEFYSMIATNGRRYIQIPASSS
jgi:hypothetical protein